MYVRPVWGWTNSFHQVSYKSQRASSSERLIVLLLEHHKESHSLTSGWNYSTLTCVLEMSPQGHFIRDRPGPSLRASDRLFNVHPHLRGITDHTGDKIYYQNEQHQARSNRIILYFRQKSFFQKTFSTFASLCPLRLFFLYRKVSKPHVQVNKSLVYKPLKAHQGTSYSDSPWWGHATAPPPEALLFLKRSTSSTFCLKPFWTTCTLKSTS